ncbi:unnamed protein product [Zymoseptoria tritici ST99CH_3D1]|uniref:FAS1 domain-containing protein n=3 Tax=Zymoseptoria tritici TaxID=1047171 RepID=A0A1X7RKG1_ZYMT9|nr:unnamed protein product [Zymoseptoria tritici ST99CH_3D7]SMR46436.1 unnamed protein product [Zymoseptoria tritici ST99CH_1E4]SMR47685.1 unnamed protein product [Zymoseptoria tritici ST99CH_3D1]
MLRTFILSALASLAFAQGDLVALLQSQPDLSTLLDFVQLVPGLANTLSQATNITIIAPTNQAFDNVPTEVPEGQAIVNRNVSSIEGLLVNHVFAGYYPSSLLSEVPTFAQTLLNTSYRNEFQPFTETPSGQYNGLVLNGENVNILSGELTVSNVIQGDIMLGEGIVIHVVDTAMSFAPPLQLFTARADLLAYNGALEAADLGLDVGLEEDGGPVNTFTDITFLVPNDLAFQAIGSVVDSVDQATLAQVLEYHIIPDNIVFSPSITNASVASLQGNDLVFSVLPNGEIFVNGAKVLFANVILSNGVAHIIDSVLNPASAPFDRASLDAAAPASDRIAFPGATPSDDLPITRSLSFASEAIAQTIPTPEILKTLSLVAVTPTSASTVPTQSGSAPIETYTGGAGARPGMMVAGVAAMAGGILAAGM